MNTSGYNSTDEMFNLDFERLFGSNTEVTEPKHSSFDEQLLSDEAIIGENSLARTGYFVRINDAAPCRKTTSPTPTVLIMEDDEVTATLLRRVLATHGYHADIAVSRAAIIEAIKTRPDLIIMDVLMPDANGFDILNRIRQHPSLADTPVLMLTALGGIEDILKGLKLGANGYLTKPAKTKALLDAIKQVLN